MLRGRLKAANRSQKFLNASWLGVRCTSDLGPDVDAPGGFVNDQELGLRSQPFSQDNLFLKAPRQDVHRFLYVAFRNMRCVPVIRWEMEKTSSRRNRLLGRKLRALQEGSPGLRAMDAATCKKIFVQMSKYAVAARHHCEAAGILSARRRTKRLPINMKYALLISESQESLSRRKRPSAPSGWNGLR